MNIRFLKSMLLLGGLAASAISASAQSQPSNLHVPFEFIAGSKVMPPGDYMIVGARMSSIVLIQSSAGNSAAVMTLAVGPGTRSNMARFTFERRGSQMFLSNIETPDESVKVSIPVQPGGSTLSRVTNPPAIQN